MVQSVERDILDVVMGIQKLPLSAELKSSIIGQIVAQTPSSRPALSAEPSPAAGILAKDLYRISRRRNEVFGENLCSDPIWEMLLDLMAAAGEDRRVYVSGLCAASGSPLTTGLRCINHMEAVGLVKRVEDRHDRRRVWVDATSKAHQTMSRLLGEVHRAAKANSPVPCF